MDTLARGRYQAAAKKLLKAFDLAQSASTELLHIVSCCCCPPSRNPKRGSRILRHFMTLSGCCWPLATGPLSSVDTGGSHTGTSFILWGFPTMTSTDVLIMSLK